MKRETYDNIVHVILLDLCGQIDVDLDPVLCVLFFNGMQQRMEPFRASKITNDPGEVDLGQPGGLGAVEVVHAVPD